MRVRGRIGVLSVGYQIAATLGSWELDPSGMDEATFAADVLSENPFWITQRPIDLELSIPPLVWMWRDVNPVRAGDRIAINLHGRPIAT